MRVEELVRNSRAANTNRAYRADWADFDSWCRARSLSPLLVNPSTVAMSVADSAEIRAINTIQRRLATISQAHRIAGLESPNSSSRVRDVLKGLLREKGSAPKQKAAIGTAELKAMVSLAGTGIAAVRDRALLLVGFASAMRRSELVSLQVEDVEFVPEEGIRLRLRKSKNDQEGVGREIGVPYGRECQSCPVMVLRAWMDSAHIVTGPLFRKVDRHGRVGHRALNPATVGTILKKRAKSVGLDEKRFGAHSLRSGFCTAAAAAGAHERSIMLQTGHRSERMLRRYIRSGSIFRENAAGFLDL